MKSYLHSSKQDQIDHTPKQSLPVINNRPEAMAFRDAQTLVRESVVTQCQRENFQQALGYDATAKQEGNSIGLPASLNSRSKDVIQRRIHLTNKNESGYFEDNVPPVGNIPIRGRWIRFDATRWQADLSYKQKLISLYKPYEAPAFIWENPLGITPTSFDNELGEYGYIGEFETEKVRDTQNQFTRDLKGNGWWASKSVKPGDFTWLKKYVMPVQIFNEDKFLIQCAVAGGEIYRTVLKGYQPTMQYREENGVPYRLSSEVQEFQDWPSDSLYEDDEDSSPDEEEELPKSTLIIDNDTVKMRLRDKDPKPISNVMSVFVTALLLGDMDLSSGNLGFKERLDQFSAVKIDPECCFSNFFFEDNILQILQRPVVGEEEYGFALTFSDTLRASLSKDEHILKLINSKKEQEDMLATISKIVDNLGNFTRIIDQCIDPEFDFLKTIIKQELQQRIAVFYSALKARK